RQQARRDDAGEPPASWALCLQCEGVARRAAVIANHTLGGHTLTPGDFSTVDGSLVVSPPTTGTAGSYGASIIGVSFQGPNVRIAQVGLDSLLQAYSAARIAAVRAQTDTAVLGIKHAIASINALMASISGQLATASLSLPPDNQAALRNERQLLAGQLAALETARTQAVANEQATVAQRPTIDTQPTALANHRWA